MSRVLPALRRSVAPIPRLVILAVYLGCILAQVAGAHGDGRPSAPRHVEAQGITKHHVHNEATCVACVILSVVGNSSPSSCSMAIAAAHQLAERPVAIAPTLVASAPSLTYPSRASPSAV
jgi:hypothetical protein